MTSNIEKQLAGHMKLPYTVVLRPDEDGDVVASVQELEGCVAHGADQAEALANLATVKRMWLTAALNAGKQIPLPQREDDDLPSGKWVQRVPRSLHKRLVEVAKKEGVSLNSLVQTYLGMAVGQHISSCVEVQKPVQAEYVGCGYQVSTSAGTAVDYFCNALDAVDISIPSTEKLWSYFVDTNVHHMYTTRILASALARKGERVHGTTKKTNEEERLAPQVH
ncbi:MAG: toxin-antitoxin system HicB family antitoxin [Acidobacteriaceae bacterium]